MKPNRAIPLTVLCLAFCGAGGGCLYKILREIKSINEPDPITANTKWEREEMARSGLTFKVERPLYVNRDYNGFIFLGRLDTRELALRLVSSTVSGIRPLELDTEAFEKRFEPSFGLGLLRVIPLRDGRKVVAIIPKSEPEEFRQAEKRFRTKADELAKELLVEP